MNSENIPAFRKIGLAICEALNVNSETVVSIDLHIAVGEPVVLTVKRVIRGKAVIDLRDKFSDVLSSYHVVPITEERDVTTLADKSRKFEIGTVV